MPALTRSAAISLPRTADVPTIVVLVIGVMLWWASNTYPAEMPAVAPWEFSWIDYLSVALPFAWYFRGVALTPADARPHALRQVAFVTGAALVYGVLLTQFLYLSQHMFFISRLQHMTLHHLAPFLIALAWPGETIDRGAPETVRRIARARWLKTVLRIVQNPVIAGVLFVGLVWLWLQPAIHFQAMISPVLYQIMNQSMLIDGLLFWFLILDPRPCPPARHNYAVRMVTCILVIFPQLLLGANLTFTLKPLYAYYDLCGRVFPSVSALLDQHLGGVVVWIPSSMMSSIAFMMILNNVRLQEDRQNGGDTRNDIQVGPGIRVSSASWTGR